MPINVNTKDTKGDYAPVPAGNHVARIYSIIHIGTTLEDTPWGAKERNKVRITWELPNETKVFKEENGPQPFSISGTYTLNWGEKANLRKLVEGMLGTALYTEEVETFDLETLIGSTCLLNVAHNQKDGKTYANIVSAAPLPKGMTAPDAINTPFILNYNDKWSPVEFEKLPEFLRDQMKKTDEYKAKNPLEDSTNLPF